MASIRDICRVCVQEVYDQDFQEINVKKFRNLLNMPFLGFVFMRKWEPEYFQDHLICNTCIENFRRMKTMYRNSYKTNTIISQERSKHKLLKINLKRLKRFSHLDGDFIVCRICLEPTSQIAIYLYDNKKNILPLKYIEAMLKHTKIYTNFSRTINPILCHRCWENLQTSYSFSKHLEMVTEKIMYYQSLISKIYINRENLQEAFDIWDHLNVPDIEVLIKKEVADETYQDKPKSNIVKIKEENEDIKPNPEIKIKNQIETYIVCKKSTDKIKPKQCTNEATIGKMPRLIVQIENNLKNVSRKKIQKKKTSECTVPIPTTKQQAKDTEIKTHKTQRTISNKRVLADSENGCNPNTSEEPKIAYSKKLRSAKQASIIPDSQAYNKVDQKSITPCSKTNKNKKNNFKDKSWYRRQHLKPVTRLRLKKETSTDDFMKDLLIVSKEEIIKDKQIRKKPALNPPTYTSTPNMTNISNNQNTSVSLIEHLPSKSTNLTTNTEYTFETLNLNDDVQVKKEVIEEEELQIKREVVSECETDDDFNESNDVQFTDDCPNLVSFIKSEPLDLTDLDEDQPPELEFQGLCSSQPALFSAFTIQNAYTVEEKRSLINACNDKESSLIATPIDAGNVIKNEEIVLPPFRNKMSDLLTSPTINYLQIYENFTQKKPVIQVKKDLLRNTNLPHSNEHENGLRSEQVRKNSKITGTKIKPSIKQAPSAFLMTKPQLDTHIPNHTSNNKQRLISEALLETQSRHIGPEAPFFCNLCDFSTKSQQASRSHLSMHCTDTLHLHYCSVCPYKTTTQKKLIKHVAEHNKIDNHPCSVCKGPIDANYVKKKFNRNFHACCLKTIESYPETKPLCRYCEKPLENNVVACRKCKSFMHRGCFVLDLTEKKFSCIHYAESPFVTKELLQIWICTNDNLEGGKSTSDTFAQEPSTSKEVKQELLDKHIK